VSGEIRYPTVEQAKGLHELVLKATGGERGHLSTSNLEFVLDAVKEIGEGLERRRAIVKKAAFLIH